MVATTKTDGAKTTRHTKIKADTTAVFVMGVVHPKAEEVAKQILHLRPRLAATTTEAEVLAQPDHALHATTNLPFRPKTENKTHLMTRVPA